MKKHQLLVGWHRGVVTPREPVPLSGMGKNMARMATYNVVDELMASITVFADETGLQNAVLFCCLDWLLIPKDITENAAAAISSATGIAKDRIFFSCSHTHCGPDVGSSHRCMGRYLAWIYGVLPRYAKAAVPRYPTPIWRMCLPKSKKRSAHRSKQEKLFTALAKEPQSNSTVSIFLM